MIAWLRSIEVEAGGDENAVPSLSIELMDHLNAARRERAPLAWVVAPDKHPLRP